MNRKLLFFSLITQHTYKAQTRTDDRKLHIAFVVRCPWKGVQHDKRQKHICYGFHANDLQFVDIQQNVR